MVIHGFYHGTPLDPDENRDAEELIRVASEWYRLHD